MSDDITQERLLYLYASASLRCGEHDDSLAALNRLLALNPRHVKAHILMGDVYDALDVIDSAIKWYSGAVRLDSTYWYAWSSLGYGYLMAEKYLEAIEPLKRAASLNPDCLSAYYNLGHVYYSLEQYDRAVAAFQTLTKKHSDYAPAWAWLGRTHWELDNIDSALRYMRKATSLAPEDEDNIIDLAVLCGIKGKDAQAVRMLKGLLERCPVNPRALYRLGVLYVNDSSRLKEGIDLLKRCHKFDPQNAEPLFLIANTYICEEKFAAAIPYYQKVLKIDPNHVDALYFGGAASAFMGAFGAARSDYARLRSIDIELADHLLGAIKSSEKYLGPECLSPSKARRLRPDIYTD